MSSPSHRHRHRLGRDRQTAEARRSVGGGYGSESSWQPLASQYLRDHPTALAFDPTSPLLFTGSPQGSVASYFCSPTTGLASRYTSYRAHWGPVGDCTVDNTGILSVGGGGLRPGVGGSIKMATRRGIALWSIESVSVTVAWDALELTVWTGPQFGPASAAHDVRIHPVPLVRDHRDRTRERGLHREREPRLSCATRELDSLPKS